MLTRCPACTTTFRVQPEQLKARQGKVRCGECQQVFNALDSLIEEFVLTPSLPATDYNESGKQEDSPLPAAQYPVADQYVGLPEWNLRHSGLAVPAVDVAPNGDAVPEGDAISPGLTFTAPVPELSVHADESPAVIESAQDIADVASESHELPALDATPDESLGESTLVVETLGLDAAPAAETLVPLAADHVATGDEVVVVEPPVTEVVQPVEVTAEPEPVAIETPAPRLHSLVTDVPSDEFQPDLHYPAPASAGVSTWLWAGGVVFAIVALILQSLMIFRVEIATMAPETRHVFVTACDLVGCTVELPKKIELLSIESSDLHPDPAFPDQAGHLGVQLSLRNRAPFAQTWPHLELSLTDTSDTVIVRRVFTAKDYLIARAPSETMLAQGIGPREDVALELALDVGELVASGYRLYLFYP